MNAIIENVKTYLKEHGNDILMGLGITGMVGGTVMACVATTKLDSVMQEYRTKLQAITTCVYGDEKQRKKDILKLRGWLTWELTKLYGPSVVVEGLSTASILSGYGGVKKTCGELAVTCMGLERTIAGYRGRVKDVVGEEKEEQIWLGGKEEVVQEEKKDEKGEVVQEEKKEVVYDKRLPSPYARWFCMFESEAAELNNDYNRQFLERMQSLFETMLKANRYLLLNQVYEALGYKKTVAGNHVGWVYDPNDTSRDSKVDLRMKFVARRNEDGSIERCWMIDPNVDGNIEAKCLEKKLMLD